ncbi:MAG: CxxC-x17-CxxC domain-containing protein [archaeon]
MNQGRFDNRRNNFNRRDNFDRKPAEKHKAICTSCKKECEVPFKPTPGRDVFCTECWRKNRQE